jgi:cyanophycin synthetase
MTNVCDFVLRHARLRPDATAVIDRGRRIDFGSLAQAVEASARLLASQGIAPGHRVALIGANDATVLFASLAVARLGATLIALRRSMPEPMLAQYGRQLRVNCLVTDLADRVLPGLPIVRLTPTGLAKSRESGIEPADDTHPFALLIGSGTTGAPKCLQVSHDHEIGLLQTRIAASGLGPDDQVATLSPIEFTTARRQAFAALAAGSALRLFDHRSPHLMVEVLASDVTVLSSAVVSLHGLLRQHERTPEGLRRLRLLGSGGSTVSDALRVRVRERLCRQFVVNYGTNELGLLSLSAADEQPALRGSIGRPLAGVEMQVVDADGQPVACGTPGLLRVRTAHMPEGYLDDPQATRRHFRDGWFYPQDVCLMSEDGRFVHLGRADDMLIFNGINIHPAEIEHCLAEHPAVLDAAALALRDPVHQDIPICAVSLREGSTIPAQELQQFAAQRLGTGAPRAVFVLDSIARTANGKPDRAALVTSIREHAANSASAVVA